MIKRRSFKCCFNMHNILILHNNNRFKKQICEYWSCKGFKGAIMLIEAISAPLGDCFLKNILEIFSEKTFKFFYKNLCTILLRFLLEIFKKNVIFKVF